MGLIDSHAHLTYPELSHQHDAMLDRCRMAGVDQIITIGTDVADAKRAISLAEQHPGTIFAAIGIHPHQAGKATPQDFATLRDLMKRPGVVASGEMGLDYHYDYSPRDVQKGVFERQLEIAVDRKFPIIIHSREAFDDVVSILLGHGLAGYRVVFHCFTGTADEAAVLAGHGWRISFTGIVTFRDAKALQAIAAAYPQDQLMVETDSPYLSPMPVRHKKPNEPAHVAHVARFLAGLRGVDYDVLVAQTAANTRSFFGLAEPQYGP